MNYLTRTQFNILLMGELNRLKFNSIILLIFCIFSISICPARAKIELGLIKSTFVSQPTDTYTFVKQQLRYLGFKEAVTEELKAMNLDDELFWSRYTEKFEEAFLPTEEKLKKRYGIGENQKVNANNKTKFEKELRQAKLSRISRFVNLAKVISRFSVKKISRSTKNPNRRYMRMKVKVNRRALQQVYMQFVSSDNTVRYDRLIIHPKLSLENGAWTDLGVSSKSVLEGALYEHWQSWFVTNFSDLANLIEFEKVNGSSIVIVAKETKQEAKQEEGSKFSTSNDKASEENLESNQGKKIHVSDTGKLLRQLHVFLEVNILKTFEDELENYRGFSFKIFANVLDGQTGQLVSSKDLSAEPQSFSTVNIKELSSNIASSIYNLPLNTLERLKSDILKFKNVNGNIRIVVDHYPSDLIDFKKRIEEVGLAIGVKANIVRYHQGQSRLAISYSENNQKFSDFVTRLNGFDFVKDRGAVVKFSADENTIDIFVPEQDQGIKDSNQYDLAKEENNLFEKVKNLSNNPIEKIKDVSKEGE